LFFIPAAVAIASSPGPIKRRSISKVLKSFQTIVSVDYMKTDCMKKAFVLKAQSAMEYLMTYGWAILIISVVLGALFGLGVFSSGTFISTSCVPSSGYQCSSPTLLNTGYLTFTYGQSTGITEFNSYVTVASQGASLNGAGFPSFSSGLSVNTPAWAVVNGVTYSSGSSNTLTILLTNAMVPGGWSTLGDAFSGSVWVNYSTASGAGAATVAAKVATMTAKVV
jgi:hypothetical protein